MNPSDRPIEEILRSLQERAKELDCLYHIEEVLRDSTSPIRVVFEKAVGSIPMGWQYPHLCRARITYREDSVQSADFQPTIWSQSAAIVVQGETVGRLEVFYTEPLAKADEGPFLNEERRLINTIAERLGLFLAHRALQRALSKIETAREGLATDASGQWSIILEFLKRTDQNLLLRIARKMANHLAWAGVSEAIELLRSFFPGPETEGPGDDNRPRAKQGIQDFLRLTDQTFRIAARHLSQDEIISCIQTWIREDRSRFLVNAVESQDTPLPEIRAAIGRYHHLGDEIELSPAVRQGLLVSLLHRLFTDQIEFVNTAKRHIRVGDFFDLIESMIFSSRSHGKLGGKSAGLFLAMAVLRTAQEQDPSLAAVKAPRTWYITSDGVLDFIRLNSLEEVYNQKYLSIEQIRQEYPHLVQVFKNSLFPTEVMDGLSVCLDDLEGRPLIVRSSSLLEDRFGSAFSGKYKSLFLANQGSKQERMAALLDAIAEVYASTFGPDPIGYRAERGLLDVYEEMGIMIQEVVGTRVGDYFFPAFSGVAFSRNEFRWSPRIRREDGLLRMVPGLGTRAVDRLKDDYPVLIAPGQPGLRANVTPDEICRYSPKKMDVINLRTGEFETIDLATLLRQSGARYPRIRQIVSICGDDELRTPVGLQPDFERDELVVTFDGLARNTPFVPLLKSMLRALEDALGTPVDLEFAHDGKDLYLVQCRPQSRAGDTRPDAIPRDLPPERILFSANRYVSNGKVPGITHIVYVDPERYAEIESIEELNEVGHAVGRLNSLLPKRQFVLMGPGRWGSRGDIRLGVNVTYSDINNAAALIEIARKKGSYVPDLSFGTHFFQDLVESGIRYLPLYPDDEGIIFQQGFFSDVPSILPAIAPEFSHLREIVRVIDVPQVTGGLVMRLLQNADLDEAVGALFPPQIAPGDIMQKGASEEAVPEHHWRWRLRFAERIALELDAERFGVVAIYLIGSTKNATAGPGSDIDLVVHFRGTDDQLLGLRTWFEGWSLCLSELNFLRTGYQSPGLLDVHFVSDEDIEKKTSFAAKIGAITDPARLLPLKTR